MSDSARTPEDVEPQYEWQRGLTPEQITRFDGIYRSAHKWRGIAHKHANIISELMQRIAQLEDEYEFVESLNDMTLGHVEAWQQMVEQVRATHWPVWECCWQQECTCGHRLSRVCHACVCDLCSGEYQPSQGHALWPCATALAVRAAEPRIGDEQERPS